MKRRRTTQLLAFVALTLAGCSDLASDDGLLGGGACGEWRDAPDTGAWDAQAAAFEARVLELTNQHRASGGCCAASCYGPRAALASNANLQASARLHARDMAERSYFSHTSADGRTLGDRATAAGFGGCALGENIAQGQQSPEDVVGGWMQSEGHCNNMLSGRYTRLGVGYFDGARQRHVWVQNFGD